MARRRRPPQAVLRLPLGASPLCALLFLDVPFAERYETRLQGAIICAADEILTGVP